jgi:hypothetical protein
MIALFLVGALFHHAKVLDAQTVDEWKREFESGPEGVCTEDEKSTDAEISEMANQCASDEGLCGTTTGRMCQGAWKADAKYVSAACHQDMCDRICDQRRFGWCVSDREYYGIIIGAVVAFLVVVGIGAFIACRKGNAQAATYDHAV